VIVNRDRLYIWSDETAVARTTLQHVLYSESYFERRRQGRNPSVQQTVRAYSELLLEVRRYVRIVVSAWRAL